MDYSEAAMRLLDIMSEMRRSKQQKRFGHFSQGEMPILNYLFMSASHNGQDGVAPSELSAWLHVSSARTAAILNQLESKGMVTRREDARDRRRVIVSITDKGLRRVESERRAMRGHTERILRELGDDDTSEFIRIMERLLSIHTRRMAEEHNKGENSR